MMVSPDKLTDQERRFAKFLWDNSNSEFAPSDVLSIQKVPIHAPNHSSTRWAEPYDFNSVPDHVIIAVCFFLLFVHHSK